MSNLTMLTDLYELTMMYGYLKHGMERRRAVFDMFYRQPPGGSSYSIMAGVEQLRDYILNLHFDEDDLAYLRSLKLFDEEFLEKLRNFRFTADIYAVPEGSIIFPGEPIVRVEGELFQVQLIETAMLNIVGHQTLIATKANRIVRAAQGGKVMEFGLRRAQGPDAGVYGARAAVVGGCTSTSNVLTGQMFGIPVSGTHAHSWVMSFESELEAFQAYARCFPNACMLLVDTFDTLRSGVPNAITVFRELRKRGHEPVGIRLDSGDLAYLSREARRMLDEAGFPNTVIVASNDLDEYLIRELITQGARIDLWGVGTKLITSADGPALGGVYKMSAIEGNGALAPRMKRSDNPGKITLPGRKEVYRLYDEQGMAIADYITLADEVVDTSRELTIFDPNETWKRMTLKNFTAVPLLAPLFKDGQPVGENPTLAEINAHRTAQEKTFWDQYLRITNPHTFKVDLSDRLWQLRNDLLSRNEHES